MCVKTISVIFSAADLRAIGQSRLVTPVDLLPFEMETMMTDIQESGLDRLMMVVSTSD